MIGKINKGSSFGGVVNYVLGKKESKLIDADGVLCDSINSIIRSFIAQTQLNENKKQPVEHIVLAYKKEDLPLLTDAKMVELAKEYMELMKLTNTQYIIVRHEDREHPHCHIVLNRIDNDGKLLSDKHDKLKNVTVCKYLKEKHDLTFGENKAQVNIDRLRPYEKAKHEIYHILTASLNKSKSWSELRKELAKQGVTIEYKYRGQTTEVQGINFSKDGFNFKGSQIDRRYSYSQLNRQLSRNNKNNVIQKPIVKPIYESKQTFDTSVVESLIGMLSFGSNYSESLPEDPAEIEFRKKKKKKRQQIKL